MSKQRSFSSNNPFRRAKSTQAKDNDEPGQDPGDATLPSPMSTSRKAAGRPKPPPPPPSRAKDRSGPQRSVSAPTNTNARAYEPTSTSKPSRLMQESLRAAAKASNARNTANSSLHVMRTPTGPEANSESSSTTNSIASSSSTSSPRKSSTVLSTPQKRNIERVKNALRATQPKNTTTLPPLRSSYTLPSSFKRVAEPYVTADPGITLWSCTSLISNQKSTVAYAMVILNQPITRKDVFLRAWDNSGLRLCADGGANRLHDLFDADSKAHYLPHMIKGDLDSLRPDVRAFYESHDVPVVKDGDEYSTDLMKCLKEVERKEFEDGRSYDLVLIGGLSGRVDQTVHTMSQLYKTRKSRPRSYVLNEESLVWVLDDGSHLIDIDHDTMGQTCGLLPVGVDSSYVRTKGLKWNLDWSTSLDGDVSSSNHLLPSEPVVYVETSRPIMWDLTLTRITVSMYTPNA